MKQTISEIRERMEGCLRRMCGSITPEKRLITILLMSFVFGVASIWMFVSSIYNIGKNEGVKMQIEHITQPELLKQRDSINHLKFKNNDQQQSTDDGE